MMGYVKLPKPALPMDEHEAFITEIRQKLKKPGSVPTGRHIYRAGHAPDWTAEDEVMDDEPSTKKVIPAHKQPVKGPSRVAPTHIQAADKSTGERRRVPTTIIESSTVKTESSSRFSAPAAPTPRKISAPVIVDATSLAVPEPEEAASDEENEVEQRRAKARARAQARQEEEEEEQQQEQRHPRRRDREEEEEQQEEEEQEEEEEDESSSEESDDSADRRRMMLKPVFRSRKQRDTITERQAMEEEELAVEEAARERARERKKQSQAMVISDIKREEEEKERNAEESGMPDDRDDVDEEEELDAWKLRELKRLKRDKEERLARAATDADLERRRNMTDAEIAADNARLGVNKSAKGQKKDSYRFLQRYYHSGAFFRQGEEGEDSVYQRDFTAPTGMDRTVDKTLLPKVLQVKKFGIKGRTKYTHLVDQDTTARESNPWAAASTTSSTYPSTSLPGSQPAVVPPKRLAGTGPVDRPKHTKK